MAIDYESCEAYFQGEIRPLIFEVYTESGIPFNLIDDISTIGDDRAYCEIKDEEGNLLNTLGVTVISEEPTRKTFICSWDTTKYNIGYYRLQVWVLVNVSGATDANGHLVIEAKLASEELTRYIKN